MEHASPIPMLRPVVVRPLLGLSATGMADAEKAGLLVRPVRISKRAVAYPANELAAINAARISGSSDAEMRALVNKLHAARGAIADQSL